jgi:hypothetical protein
MFLAFKSLQLQFPRWHCACVACPRNRNEYEYKIRINLQDASTLAGKRPDRSRNPGLRALHCQRSRRYLAIRAYAAGNFRARCRAVHRVPNVSAKATGQRLIDADQPRHQAEGLCRYTAIPGRFAPTLPFAVWSRFGHRANCTAFRSKNWLAYQVVANFHAMEIDTRSNTTLRDRRDENS